MAESPHSPGQDGQREAEYSAREVEQEDRVVFDKLRQANRDDVRALLAATEALASDAEPFKWVPSTQETRIVDGVEQTSTRLGYPAYSASIHRVVALLYRVGVVPTAGYTNDGELKTQTVDMLDRASLAQTVGFLHRIVRGERFADGLIASALEDGRFLAALRRLTMFLTEDLERAWPVGPRPHQYRRSRPHA